MRISLFLCSLVSILILVTASSTSIQAQGPALSFDKNHIDLGKVKKGEKRDGVFTFTNTGTEAIEIDIVSACECTTLDWPYEIIPVGGTGEISFTFDSTEKEASETIEVDINLVNEDPKTGGPKLIIVSYSYELEL